MATENTDTTPEVGFPSDAPKGATPMTSAIWPEGAKAFAALGESVKAALSVKGTQGEFVTKAAATVNEMAASFVLELSENPDLTVGEFVAGVEQFKAELLADMVKDLTPKRAAAEEAYRQARADWDSFLNFALKDKAAAKVLDKVTVPEMVKARTSTGGSAKVTNTNLVFFSKDGDVESPMPGSQNSLSSLAWYRAKELVEGAKNGNVTALRAYAAEKGVDTNGDEWELTLPSGRVLGCRKAG